MATTGVVNGRLLLYKVNTTGTTYVAVGCATECSLSFDRETRETTCAQSGDDREFLYGLKTATGSFSGLFAFDDANHAFEDFYDLLAAGTTKTVKFTTGVVGDIEWSGTALFTNVSVQSGQNGQNVTYSGNIQFTGSITKTTIS